MAFANAFSRYIVIIIITTASTRKFQYCPSTFPVEGMTTRIRNMLIERTYDSGQLAKNHPELHHEDGWISVPDHCRPVRHGLLCDPMLGPACTNRKKDYFLCEDGIPFSCDQLCDTYNNCDDGYDEHISVCKDIYIQNSPWPNQLCQNSTINFNFTAPRDRLGD